jgi:hypothetical protein
MLENETNQYYRFREKVGGKSDKTSQLEGYHRYSYQTR